MQEERKRRALTKVQYALKKGDLRHFEGAHENRTMWEAQTKSANDSLPPVNEVDASCAGVWVYLRGTASSPLNTFFALHLTLKGLICLQAAPKGRWTSNEVAKPLRRLRCPSITFDQFDSAEEDCTCLNHSKWESVCLELFLGRLKNLGSSMMEYLSFHQLPLCSSGFLKLYLVSFSNLSLFQYLESAMGGLRWFCGKAPSEKKKEGRRGAVTTYDYYGFCLDGCHMDFDVFSGCLGLYSHFVPLSLACNMSATAELGKKWQFVWDVIRLKILPVMLCAVTHTHPLAILEQRRWCLNATYPTPSTWPSCVFYLGFRLLLMPWLHLQYGCITMLYFCTWEANWFSVCDMGFSLGFLVHRVFYSFVLVSLIGDCSHLSRTPAE